MRRIGLVVLLMTTAVFAQDRYSNSALGQMEASESLNVVSGPAAQHTLGEAASHFAAAEPGVNHARGLYAFGSQRVQVKAALNQQALIVGLDQCLEVRRSGPASKCQHHGEAHCRRLTFRVLKVFRF